MIQRLFLALSLCLAAAPLAAGISPDAGTPPEERQSPDAAEALALMRSQFVGLEGAVPLEGLPSPDCAADRRPATHAILVAADRPGPLRQMHLRGPENDSEILRNAMIARGASPGAVLRLTGEKAGYQGFAEALRQVASAAGCGDSVILQFSGFAFGADLIAPSLGQEGPLSEDKKGQALAQFAASSPDRRGPIDAIIDTAPFILLNQSRPGQAGLLSAAALSEAVTVLRNRGADVTVILDVASAEDFAVEDRQYHADPQLLQRDVVLGAGMVPVPPSVHASPLLAGAGALSVLYGTEHGHWGAETNFPKEAGVERRAYGVFSFRLASALLAADSTTANALMRHMRDDGLAGDGKQGWARQSYLYAATDPDHALIVEQRPQDAPAPGGMIRILDPAPSRAASALESAHLTLRGKVEAASDTMVVTVNGALAASRPDGSFSHEVELQAGVNRIDILAMTRDNQPITHSFELYFEGDMQALVGTGTRYALLIANQDYAAGSGLARLSTPLGDAEALAAVLRDRFGYQTEAVLPDGTKVDLFLKNANRVQIETALYQLGRVAGARDSVLIFYAGHGIYEQATQSAFWLPVDAQAGLPFTWLPASAISDAILRIEAGNVLVISDSCYSGALLRGEGGAAEAVADADRMRALQRLAGKRSRIVIASGGNEPVADGGGDGHSVFARALLTGLAGMEEEAFTARELFDRFLLPMVVGQSAQEPQYRPIERSGHEGGDVVLVRQGG